MQEIEIILDAEVVEKVKEYAKRSGVSLDEYIETVLKEEAARVKKV